MQGKQINLSGCNVGNWIRKATIGTILVLINIAANSAVAADLSQLDCRKTKINSNPYDTATAYVCKPKPKVIAKKTTLAANTNDMEVGKIYPAPVKKSKPKKTTAKKQIKKKIRKNIKKNTAPRTVTPKAAPMISFNYDLIHQDHQINSLRTNKPKLIIAKTTPIAKPNKLANNSSKSGHPYIGVMFGTSIAKAGEDQWDKNQNLQGGWYKYESTSGYKANMAYGLNGGYEFKAGNNTLLSLGIGIYQSPKLTSDGKIYLSDTQPIEQNKTHRYNYNYQIKSSRFMVETKLAWIANFTKYSLIPYVSLGIGPAINSANNYEQKSVASQPEGPTFRSHTNASFAYQVGAGLALPFNKDKDRFALGYRFIHAGTAKFDIREKSDPYRLETGKIKTHDIYFSYIHLFNI